MARYGYARVSTYGQDLDAQIQELKREGVEVKNILSEHFTGTKMARPKFDRLMKKLREGDYLVVTKLDRFARTTVEGIKIIQELFERGVKVHVLNMGLIENTPTGRLMFNVIVAFAEFERDLIVERTTTGKKLAKEKNPNFREGRKKKYTPKQMQTALKFVDEGYPVREVAEMVEINFQAIYRELNNRKAKEQFNEEFERLDA
jgi:DNA invertase Pin-like site-specific DNA recombinase